MGIDVSGINISAIKSKISGFSIVRTDRDKTIINQGLIIPTVINADDSTKTNPLPVAHQDFNLSNELYGVKSNNDFFHVSTLNIYKNLAEKFKY